MRLRLLWALLLLLFLQGCSSLHSDTKFSLYNPSQAQRVWPAPPLPGKIEYLGELVGEQNIVSSNTSKFISNSQRLFKRLVGLNQHNKKQVILQRPQSGTVDALGNIYVTDVSRQAVFVFSPLLKSLQVWEYAKKGIRFISPIGIGVDGQGGVWVADSSLGWVTHLNALGEPLGIIGADELTRPTGLVVDINKQWVFVTDTALNTIKVFDYTGTLLRTMGAWGEAKGLLNGPTYLAYSHGELYVSDTLNARVQRFSGEGEVLGVIGQRGMYLGDTPRPKGIAVDNRENLYVVESYYDYLLIFDKQGNFLLPVGGSGKAIGQFYLPAGVWVDSKNRIYVADMFNGRVVVFQLLD